MKEILQGRRAIITGAADGIGRATAELFCRQGARVVAVDINGPLLHASFKDYPAVQCLAVDLMTERAAEKIVEFATQTLGGLDILVNNAGVTGDRVHISEAPDALWRNNMGVNLEAPLKLARAALPLLKQSGAARIVNTASVCSLYAIEYLGAYCVSKHALLGLTRVLAREYGAYGIRVNCILPGNTDGTSLSRGAIEPITTDRGRRYLANTSVVGRHGQPIDQANAILFLASDLADFVAGHALVVDGGMTCMLPSTLD